MKVINLTIKQMNISRVSFLPEPSRSSKTLEQGDDDLNAERHFQQSCHVVLYKKKQKNVLDFFKKIHRLVIYGRYLVRIQEHINRTYWYQTRY